MTTKEVVSEYLVDDETGKLKLVKQKVSEKSIPPNTDLLKIFCQKMTETDDDFDKLTDEELEKEKIRLILELKEEENACGKRKTKGEM